MRLSQILDNPDQSHRLVGSTVAVCGWIRTVRAQKEFTFVKVNDGSTVRDIQAVILPGTPGYEEIRSQGAGASVRICGEVVRTPSKNNEVEISCSSGDHSVRVIGSTDSKAYPLAKKKHGAEYLRTIAHLRPRTKLIGAVSRVRNALAAATHGFFQDRGFLYVHTPIITTVDCEGAGEMFRVVREGTAKAVCEDSNVERRGKSGNLDKPKMMEKVASKEFFHKPAYLTVSGQLAVENVCCSLGDVYTFGPTFRAETSNTTRHLAEFWMIEPEIAFADLVDNMDCAEDYIRHCVAAILDKQAADLEFLSTLDSELMERLRLIARSSFHRISYTDAVEALKKAVVSGEASFEYEVSWGKELQTEHEKWLTDKFFKRPTIVYDYPKECKPFYMRTNDDGKTVAAMDILCPGIGELAGGSQREERLNVLEQRISELGMDGKDYWWYKDLRKYGTVPHAGFGVGFERLVMVCTGVSNIRDVMPFPRYNGHAEF